MASQRTWTGWLIRGAILLGLLIGIAVAILVVINLRAYARLEKKLDQLRASGVPTSIAELAPAEIPDEENAAVTLMQAGERLEEFGKDYAEFYNSPLGEDCTDRQQRGELPTPEQLERMEAVTAKYDDLMAMLQKAGEQQQYASLLDYTGTGFDLIDESMDLMTSERTIARFCSMNMDVLVARGQTDDAVATGILLLKLCRYFDQEPFLVQRLVAIACRGVAVEELSRAVRYQNVSSELRNQLNDELKQQFALRGMQETMLTECVYSLDFLSLDSDMLCCFCDDIDSCIPLNKMLGWWHANGQVEILEYYDQVLPLMAMPWYMGQGKMGQIGTELSPLAQMAVSGGLPAYAAANRDLALQRCLRIVNELARYKATHGEEASGLKDLSIPAEECVDPFSGEPLLLKPTDKGWKVYSVYKNGVDDGGELEAKFNEEGELEEQLDVGFAP